MNVNDRRVQTYTQLENKNILFVLERSPHVNYYCTSVSLPGVSSTAARQMSPFSDVKHTGDKLVWQPLIVNFNVDEQLTNWLEIHNWMRSYAHPESFDEYADKSIPINNLYRSKLSSATLIIPNNKYNTTHKFQFIDVFPVDLTDVVFDNQITGTTPQIATATFEYTTYNKTS
jgi:hypothetical protein